MAISLFMIRDGKLATGVTRRKPDDGARAAQGL
jgi:hypothetical protein